MRPLRDLLFEPTARHSMTPTSRRGVLALALAAAPAAIGADAMSAKGKKTSKKDKKNADTRGKGDIGVLNYALTLEHLEYAFYRDGLATFVNTADFADPSIRPRLEEIRDHEQAHVDALVSTIRKLGGNPVQAGCYNFGYGNSASQFLKVAQVLENTGVMAYDGAIASIMSANLQTTGATIATVEARHAAYLNLINGEDPFPAAFDTPKSRAEILAAAGGFIVSCSS